MRDKIELGETWANCTFGLPTTPGEDLLTFFPRRGLTKSTKRKTSPQRLPLLRIESSKTGILTLTANGYLVVKVPSFGRVRNVAGVKNEAQDSGFVEAETEEGKF